MRHYIKRNGGYEVGDVVPAGALEVAPRPPNHQG